MTKIFLNQLVWDSWNTEHIKKHNVSKEDIEDAILHLLTNRLGRNGKIVLIGRSGKRLLALIIGHEKGNTYYVVTARDADKKERRLVYAKEDKKENK